MQDPQAVVDDTVAGSAMRWRTALTGVIGAGGDLNSGLFQSLADRLDPVLVTVLVDEGVDVYSRRSSSA